MPTHRSSGACKIERAERALENGKAKEETFRFLCLPDTVDPRGVQGK